jgi:hypothetical protein
LQNENEMLRNKLKDIQEVCNLCSTKMNANIIALQEDILKYQAKSDLEQKDNVIYLAIAGLKQVNNN